MKTDFIFAIVCAALLSGGCCGNGKTAEAPQDKFELSAAGYNFLDFDIETTLKALRRMDIHNLCVKDFHLPLNSTDEQIAGFKAKCGQYGVNPYGVGPIYMKTAGEVDKAFDYASRLGARILVSVPNYEILPYVNEKLELYPDIKVAIHLHGPDLPVFQDATVVWDKIKDMNPRMGMCLDVGHDTRNGSDPAIDMVRYASRIFDMHIKDVTAAAKEGGTVECGRGIMDFPALIGAMRKVGYDGKCSLEFEKDMDDPFMGLAESYGYLKAAFKYVR